MSASVRATLLAIVALVAAFEVSIYAQTIPQCNQQLPSTPDTPCADNCQIHGSDSDEYWCDPSSSISPMKMLKTCVPTGGRLDYCKGVPVVCGNKMACEVTTERCGTQWCTRCKPTSVIVDGQGNPVVIYSVDADTGSCFVPPG